MPSGVIIRHFTEAKGHVQATFLDRLAEWTFAAQLLSWGLILLRPEDSFAVSRSMTPLARLAPEYAWGLYAVSVGGVRVVALFINGWVLPHTYLFRIVCSFLSVLAWLTITLGVFNSGTAGPALAIYPWIMLAEIVCLYRVGRDYAQWKQVQSVTREA